MLRVRRSGSGDSGRGFFVPSATATATVGVRQQGRLLATARLVWRGVATRVKETETSLATDGFVGVYDTPPVSSTRRPAVLVLGGSDGGNGGTFLARLLASHGYPALSIAYFKAPGLPSELRNIPLEYFEGAIRWLAARPGVDPDKVMILGASRGGEAALLIGSTYPTLVHGVIAYVPSANVSGSCCRSFAYPAWTLHGKPIPFGLNSPIAVEKIAGPILAIGATLDGVWPSYIAVPTIVLRAKEHGKNDVTGVVYRGAGHAIGVGVPNLPTPDTTTVAGRTLSFGGSVAADAQARENSWHRVLALLKKVTRPS
jgi:dienelactone hydrolase